MKKFLIALVFVCGCINSAYSYSTSLNRNLSSLEEVQGALNDYAKEIGLNTILGGFEALCATTDNVTRNKIITDIENARLNNPRLYYLETQLLIQWKLYSAAAIIYQEIIDEGFADADDFYVLALLQQQNNQALESLSTLNAGLEKFPSNEDLLFAKAEIFNTFGNTEESIPILNKLIDINYNNANYHARKGKALLIEGKYNNAITSLENAISIEDNPVTRTDLMFAYYLTGNKQKTAENGKAILKFTSFELRDIGLNPNMYHALGFAGMGDRENALETVKYDMDRVGDQDMMVVAMVDILLGDTQDAMRKLRPYALKEDKMGTQHLFFSPYIYPLHSFPEFKNIAEQKGFEVYRDANGLLRPTFAEYSNIKDGFKQVDELRTSSNWLEDINKQCPIDMGQNGMLMSVTADPYTKVVKWNYQVQPDQMDLDMLSNVKYNRDFENIQILNLIIKEPGILKETEWSAEHIFYYPDNSKRVVLSITPSKVKEVAKTPVTQNRLDKASLQYLVDVDDYRYRSLNEGSVELTDNYLIETLFLPEDKFAAIEIAGPNYKNAAGAPLKNPGMRLYTEAMVRLNIGYKAIFINRRSNKKIEFIFTPQEIRSLL